MILDPIPESDDEQRLRRAAVVIFQTMWPDRDPIMEEREDFPDWRRARDAALATLEIDGEALPIRHYLTPADLIFEIQFEQKQKPQAYAFERLEERFRKLSVSKIMSPDWHYGG